MNNIIVKMDHIVYLNHKAKELENLRNGAKSMIIQGAMGRKLPYGILNQDNTKTPDIN